MTTPMGDDPTASGGFLSSDNTMGGFSYGVGVSVGILILITTITLASYFCTRESNTQDDEPSSRQHHDIETGIDEATLKTYPKLAYSQLMQDRSKLDKGATTTTTVSCCSICLGDYKGKDVIRLLPECGHVFHLKCVDPWLRVHPTCPVCRTSPLPTPQSTPLSQASRINVV